MRRRAALLVLTLLTLALLAALVLPLAQTSGVAAVDAARVADGLRHRLAAHSAVAVLPQLLAARDDLRRALEQGRSAEFSLALAEDLSLTATIQDDSAKLPLQLLRTGREQKLAVLSSQLPLPALIVSPAERADCLEDLFERCTDGELYGREGWSAYVTPLDSQVQVWRAAPAVLMAALADQDARFVARLIQARFGCENVETLLARAEATPAQARIVSERLMTRSARYSLLVRSTLGRQTRARYLIVAAEGARVLAEWEVAP